MERYGNLAGDSGVVAYVITSTSILVKFAGSDRLYEYSHASAGRTHVETMKRLARAGRGLSTYISRHVADDYVRSLEPACPTLPGNCCSTPVSN